MAARLARNIIKSTFFTIQICFLTYRNVVAYRMMNIEYQYLYGMMNILNVKIKRENPNVYFN